MKKKYGKKITIINKSVGSKKGKLPMLVSKESTLSTFSENFIDKTKSSGNFASSEWNETRQIEMTTLDDLINEHGVPKFIKIDVEGFKLEVIKGLTRPIENISFEYNVPEFTHQVAEILKELKKITPKDIICNYSIGESLEWGMIDWISIDDMIKFVYSPIFLETRFGDIYIKNLRLINNAIK